MVRDHKKQLREAGHPFDHIGTELTALQGRFEVVSTDVRMMKDQFDRKASELSGKIETETRTIATQLTTTKTEILDHVDISFDRKFYRTCGMMVAAISIMYGAVTYLQGTSLNVTSISAIAIIVGVAILIWTLRRKTEKGNTVRQTRA